jgi:hypothetical protein
VHAERLGEEARRVGKLGALLVAVNLLQADERGPADLGVVLQKFNQLLQVFAGAVADVVGDDLDLRGVGRRRDELARAPDFEERSRCGVALVRHGRRGRRAVCGRQYEDGDDEKRQQQAERDGAPTHHRRRTRARGRRSRQALPAAG